jgi:hypothetical protein
MHDLVYSGDAELNYIVKKATNPSDTLVISFPGQGNADFAASQLGYTYMMTIGAFNVNALYLKAVDKDNVKSRLTCVNCTTIKAIQRSTNCYMGLRTPVKGKDSRAFRNTLPQNKLADAPAYRFQQTILNHYKHSGDIAALEWVGDNVRYFLTYLRICCR